MEIIGRMHEINSLGKIMISNKSEFLAVYGRRRVGKTFLIRSYFNDQFSLHVTGLNNPNRDIQLDNFYSSLTKNYKLKKGDAPAQDWFGAFDHLIAYLEKLAKKKKVLFFDELPWMATAQSNFLSALEHFWNHWASSRGDIVLIVCGSAASWIVNNLLKNKGGLHNRVTRRMKLLPFTLPECELFLKRKKFDLSRYEIVKLYMTLGGIPFYLDMLDNSISVTQNIDELCFTSNGALREEFDEIYASIFKNSDNHKKIVKALAGKSSGLSRLEIIKITKLANAGSTTRVLEELEQSGFINQYPSYGKKQRDTVYHLTDFLSIFHLRFMTKYSTLDKNVWSKMLDHPSQRAWSGYTFELVCMMHIDQVKQALGISGIETQSSTWQNDKAQIDLLIDRRDNVISICEVKFSLDKFLIDKRYREVLQNKMTEFRRIAPKSKSLHLVMITTFGLAESKYKSMLVHKEISMDELFIRI